MRESESEVGEGKRVRERERRRLLSIEHKMQIRKKTSMLAAGILLKASPHLRFKATYNTSNRIMHQPNGILSENI